MRNILTIIPGFMFAYVGGLIVALIAIAVRGSAPQAEKRRAIRIGVAIAWPVLTVFMLVMFRTYAMNGQGPFFPVLGLQLGFASMGYLLYRWR